MDYDFQFDEMHQAGASHADPKRALEYDSKMQKFRNYSQEAKEIARLLNINDQMHVLDMGAGTGALTLELAHVCKEVTAVDVSAQMLNILTAKAHDRNISNINIVNSGFLTYDSKGRKFDRIISNVVLHHLPDFWKCIALRRMHSILQDDGMFLLSDVVFSFPMDDYRSEMNGFLSNLEKQTDAEFVRDGVLHFKEEFSTFDWLLDQMIERAGFRIKEKNRRSSTGIGYVLMKEKIC